MNKLIKVPKTSHFSSVFNRKYALAGMVNGPLAITFLGTASAVPSHTRNHSSLVLKYDAGSWMFDCGEGTQKQMQRAGDGVRMGQVKRIFITHMHGDHVFGIVPLMASVLCGAGGTVGASDPRLDSAADKRARAETGEDEALEIYGPLGLREYIRRALRLTYTNLGGAYRVTELHFPTDQPQPEGRPHPLELSGKNILPHGDGLWRDFCVTPNLIVSAGPILHSAPCIGFVVQETNVPGKMNPALYAPHLKRNKEALAAEGIANPMKLLASIQQGIEITLPDGTRLTPPAPRVGRKIAILGDTYDPSPMTALCEDADLLIHEATNAHLPDIDRATKTTDTFESVQERTICHGHSTPQMAGAFARRVGAKRLCLNHFSSRYKGDESEEAMSIMEGIRALAIKEFGSDDVTCARDFMRIEVKRQDE
ncbi:hypothetical protein YB2330_002541 [Saitoella coloradoensis]